MSFSLANKSLLIMKPGCQDKLKHIILPDDTKDARYCLSYRTVKPLDSQPSSQSPTPDPPSPKVTVLLGTSMTKRLDPVKLVGRSPAKPSGSWRSELVRERRQGGAIFAAAEPMTQRRRVYGVAA